MICQALQGGGKSTHQKKDKTKKKKSKPLVMPGDKRANKGLVYLKDQYIPVFRQPYFQGLPESFVPVLMMRCLAGYTRQWHLSQAVTVLWLALLLKYFTFDAYYFGVT